MCKLKTQPIQIKDTDEKSRRKIVGFAKHGSGEHCDYCGNQDIGTIFLMDGKGDITRIGCDCASELLSLNSWFIAPRPRNFWKKKAEMVESFKESGYDPKQFVYVFGFASFEESNKARRLESVLQLA